MHWCVDSCSQMDQQDQSYMFASLKRPHSEQLLQGLQLLRQDHELCDIVLRVGDSKIHAHKVVLASISPYFKAMFTGNLSEKETSEVEFQCIDETALQVCLEPADTSLTACAIIAFDALSLLGYRRVCLHWHSVHLPGNCGIFATSGQLTPG